MHDEDPRRDRSFTIFDLYTQLFLRAMLVCGDKFLVVDAAVSLALVKIVLVTLQFQLIREA